MNELNVFNYQSSRQFLLDCFNKIKTKNSSFSIRAWARKINCSHAQLVMILQGKRPLRLRHLAFLQKSIKLSSQELLYLQALVQFDSATTAEEKDLAYLWLSELNPGKNHKSKDIEHYHAIAHWVHAAILAMTDLADFSCSEREISRRLRGKVTPIEVRSALKRLIELELIQKNENGKFKAVFQRTSTPDDLKNEGARQYHLGVMKLAEGALEDVTLDKREFQSFAFAINETKLPLAKKMIRRFRERLAEAVGSENASNVYQMNMQFFQLTETL